MTDEDVLGDMIQRQREALPRVSIGRLYDSAYVERLEAQLRDVTAELAEEREKHQITGEFAEAMQKGYATIEAERDRLREGLQKLYDATNRANRPSFGGPTACVICGHNIGCMLNCVRRDARAALERAAESESA